MQRGGIELVHSSDIQVVLPSIFQENRPDFSCFLFAYQEIRSKAIKRAAACPSARMQQPFYSQFIDAFFGTRSVRACLFAQSVPVRMIAAARIPSKAQNAGKANACGRAHARAHLPERTPKTRTPPCVRSPGNLS